MDSCSECGKRITSRTRFKIVYGLDGCVVGYHHINCEAIEEPTTKRKVPEGTLKLTGSGV